MWDSVVVDPIVSSIRGYPSHGFTVATVEWQMTSPDQHILLELS